MDVIEVNDLHRRYGGPGKRGFEAVRSVSFSVRPGELFALLGTNGAGKTSALEVIEGLTRPTSGTVRVLGHDPWRERRLVRPRIGIMLQDGGFPSDLTVAETGRMLQVHRLERLGHGAGRAQRAGPSPRCSFWTSPAPGSIRRAGGAPGAWSATCWRRGRPSC